MKSASAQASTSLSADERSALLALCVRAAQADGAEHAAEDAEINRIIESLGAVRPSVSLVAAPLSSLAARLQSQESRELAYQMAVCICDADDALGSAEKRFLDELRSELGLAAGTASAFRKEAEALAGVPLASAGAAPPVIAELPATARSADPETDRVILNAAILCGALELLPDRLASMAIIPLQMKLVYRIGKQHGHTLDRGHIRDFLATAGIGLTSQVVERYALNMLGGLAARVSGKLLGRVGGSMVGKLGKAAARQAISSGFSFATTYALGQAARQYYAGGRKFSAVRLQELFSSSLAEAKSLQARYAPQIQERARAINPSELLRLVRQQ